MDEAPHSRPAGSSRRTVRRVTQVFAVAAAATALFAGLAAAARPAVGEEPPATATDDAWSDDDSGYDDSGYDDSYGLAPPSSVPSFSGGAPSATSGGS